jgi:N-acetylmuramoyl-L-alanine amidase
MWFHSQWRGADTSTMRMPGPLARHIPAAVVIGLPLSVLAVALAAALPSGSAAAGTVTVQPGQTLSQLALRYQTTVSALGAANGITDPDKVEAGEILQVPGPGPSTTSGAPRPGFATVEVEPGDTLTSLAARFGTTPGALAAANGIRDPNRIDAGTVLQLPASASGATPGSIAAPGGAAPAGAGTITVHAGDTLTSLAAHYGTTPGALAAANGISDPNVISAGMRLIVPPVTVTATAAAGSPEAQGPVATGDYPTPLLSFPRRLALQPDFVHSASVSGVPVALLEAVCWWESGWQVTAMSGAGAIGVCQILPSTAAFVSSTILQVPPLDPRDPADNIALCAAYLRYLLNSTGGNDSQALAGYYQGLASIAQEGPLPSTQAYVKGILAYAAIFAGTG